MVLLAVRRVGRILPQWMYCCWLRDVGPEETNAWARLGGEQLARLRAVGGQYSVVRPSGGRKITMPRFVVGSGT